VGTTALLSFLKEVVLRIFITIKNPSSSAGFEPANIDSSSKHANHWTAKSGVGNVKT
jgi:hypothetical protein